MVVVVVVVVVKVKPKARNPKKRNKKKRKEPHALSPLALLALIAQPRSGDASVTREPRTSATPPKKTAASTAPTIPHSSNNPIIPVALSFKRARRALYAVQMWCRPDVASIVVPRRRVNPYVKGVNKA